jgi:hypothetical protein
MLKIVALSFIAALIVTGSAMATINQPIARPVQIDHTEIIMEGDRISKRVVKAPQAHSVVMNNSWPCGSFIGASGIGQYVGGTVGMTTDSATCVIILLAGKTDDPVLKEGYMCQIKYHRIAKKNTPTPCPNRKLFRHNPRPTR